MDILGILDLDPDQHENLCGSETLHKTLKSSNFIINGVLTVIEEIEHKCIEYNV